MSVIVKGMEMPKMCAECDFMGGLLMNEGIYTCVCPVDTINGMNISDEIEKDCRHPNCPLGELPYKHGRLVDADELWNELGIIYGHCNGSVRWNDAVMEIKNAPTM